MPEIISPSNPKIKLVRALQTQAKKRKQKNSFVIEGVRLIEEANASEWPFDFLLYDKSLSDRGKRLLDSIETSSKVDIFETTSSIMNAISATETPQGILAVLKSHTYPLPDNPTFIILADRVRDPGNLGTIIRTAEAAGADGIILTPGTVDAFAPKVLRAGMGAHFHLPIQQMPWHEIHRYLKGLPVFLASSNPGTSLWETDLKGPCALLIGSEAFGASPLGEEFATHHITIPMVGRAESLNAAVAAAILMTEVMRQRNLQKKDN
jgi:TrmH family RNA methyltransferase